MIQMYLVQYFDYTLDTLTTNSQCAHELSLQEGVLSVTLLKENELFLDEALLMEIPECAS